MLSRVERLERWAQAKQASKWKLIVARFSIDLFLMFAELEQAQLEAEAKR